MENKLPSVTQLIPKPDFFCTPAQLEAALQEGIETHSKVEMYFSIGNALEDPELKAVEKAIKSNTNFLGRYVQHEERLSNNKFSGKPDVIFEKAIVDFKRSLGNKKYHALQLAGYHILAVENKIIKPTRKWYIAYPVNGVYKLVNVYNELATDIFKGLVNKYYIEQAYNNYMEK